MDESLFEKPTNSSCGGDMMDPAAEEEAAEILEGMINNLSFEVEGLDLEFIKNQPDIISSSASVPNPKRCETKEKKPEENVGLQSEKGDGDVEQHCESGDAKLIQEESSVGPKLTDQPDLSDMDEIASKTVEQSIMSEMEKYDLDKLIEAENYAMDNYVKADKSSEQPALPQEMETKSEELVKPEIESKPTIITEPCDIDCTPKTLEPTPTPSDTTQGLKPETLPSGIRRKSVRFSESIDFPHRYDSSDEGPLPTDLPDDYELSRETELREIRLQKQYSLLLRDRMRAEQKLFDAAQEYSPSNYTKIAIAVSIIAAFIIFIRYLIG